MLHHGFDRDTLIAQPLDAEPVVTLLDTGEVEGSVPVGDRPYPLPYDRNGCTRERVSRCGVAHHALDLALVLRILRKGGSGEHGDARSQDKGDGPSGRGQGMDWW